MLKADIHCNRFYVTTDNRVVLPRWWDSKKKQWCVTSSRRDASGHCKSGEIVREITPEEADRLMVNVQWGFVPYFLQTKQIAAEFGVNVILPWEPLPKDYVPERRNKQREEGLKIIAQWV